MTYLLSDVLQTFRRCTMINRSVVFCLLFLGCASSVPPSYLDETPRLIETTSLPPLPTSIVYRNEIILEVKLHVGADGTVRDLIWVASSRNKEWDSLAANRIMTWKYNPASKEGKNVPIWVRQSVKVVTVEAEALLLREIVCLERAIADSVYAMLKVGADFAELARKFSISETAKEGGYRGKLNLAVFPLTIRDRLSRLGNEEVTEPLLLGSKYVIYKRVQRRPVVG